MDPVSEMQAREWFEAKGLTVVGWYHSHPAFVAIPSIRDIETQMSYQVIKYLYLLLFIPSHFIYLLCHQIGSFPD